MSVTGLPTTLAVGDSATYALSFTAPQSGSVPIAAAVATTTPETVAANNTAAAAVAVGVVAIPALGPLGIVLLALLAGILPGIAVRRRR